ncbi:DUF72 domain-containing protein [Bordetella genomosp. 12]|uniref:DUF72 domain-containing protein n=1 Tax=Bordetella genomosp. 12 TaxID=463035 RepID=A0A261VNL6_9BORD|nr:DUF72 domain-containing protein [Bordetella genomosp. 12]OZI75062.1 hypothetical protein CAL22_11665 [Bordetella genomosp. 12]
MTAIRAGIGGWTYPPWRDGVFYPPGLPHARELSFAARQFSAIEVNGTFYRSQKPSTFAAWAAQVPDGFKLALKAPRYATHRQALSQAGDSVRRFLDSGIDRLGPALGPLLWQLPEGKVYDPADIEAFFGLLPARLQGQRLHHVLDARHPSFDCDDYLRRARAHGVATVLTDSPRFVSITDSTCADLIYVRLMAADPRFRHGYAPAVLAAWARCARQWAAGRSPDLPRRLPDIGTGAPREVYVFFINGHKALAPAGAREFLRRLAQP